MGLGKSGIGRVDEQRHDARRGNQLVQQFQPLRRYLHVQLGHARDVAARPVKAGDEAELDRVAAHFEDDRNGRGRRLCRKRRRSAGRGNHGHLTMNQIGRHCRQPIVLVFRPAVFDRDVLALDVTGFAQPFDGMRRQLSRIPRRDAASRNPITGIAGCCARAASGHAAAAPPISVMKSRRLITEAHQ